MMTTLEARSVPNGSDAGSNWTARTPFHKKLGWHIVQEEPHAIVLLITPAMAAEMLKRNEGDEWRNRLLKPARIKKYMTQLALGWRLTGETIIFTRTGRLANGQHRLLACEATGISFRTFVAFGVEDEAFVFMDQGDKRTAGDVFGIQGVADANRMAAATLWVWKYNNTKMATPVGGQSPTPAQLYDYFSVEHPELSESLKVGKRFDNKLAPPSLMTALHYLCAARDRVKADEFFRSVATGENLSRTSPALKLRNRLIQERVGGGLLSYIYTAAFTAMCWNAVRLDRAAPTLKWRSDQAPDVPFPTII